MVEFRAGQMTMRKDGSKMVDADKRKGLVQLKQSPEGIVSFIWKDRTTGTEEINLMLFPNDATFKKVESAKGRVYVLQWVSTDKKLFFWLQEPTEEKDKEYVENVNKYINNPPTPSANAGLGGLAGLAGLGGLGGRGGGGLSPDQLMQLIGGNPEALEALMGGRGMGRGAGGARGNRGATGASAAARPATTSSAQNPTLPVPTTPAATVPSTAAPPPAPGPTRVPATSAVHLDALQRIMNDMVPAAQKGPSLKDVVNVDEIIASGLFDNPQVVAKLVEFLPEGQVTAANLKENLRSPQFGQAVAMFNQALRTGQLKGIMASFGLDTSSIGPNATIEDFLKAIQTKAKEDQKKGL
uniref:Uncharacterized protein n=1 Tax=Arcella intermedia TaxID=1963864 RepID=A0A6B2L7N2_9EUKA